MSEKRSISNVQIADRAVAIDRSAIRDMFDRAKKYEGDLIHLEIGEPDFDTPEHIVDAAMDAAHRGATYYTSNAGIIELRTAIADHMQTKRGLDVNPETEIVVTTGAMEALHLAMLALVDPGEEVVIPEPAWPNYQNQAKLVGARPVTVPLNPDHGFALDVDRVTRAISQDTALVVLTRPSNPTGKVYDRDAVREIIEIAAAHDAYVIADEVYSGLEYNGSTPAVAAMCDYPEQVLTIDSVSKKYAMTGWRVGWFIGHPSVTAQVEKLHESTSACAPTPSQHAALAALTGDQGPAEEMRDTYERRRDFLVEELKTVPEVTCHPPEGAFYAFVDVSTLQGTTTEIAERLLHEHGTVVAPGIGFGDAGAGHLRLSFANSRENIESGINAIADIGVA